MTKSVFSCFLLVVAIALGCSSQSNFSRIDDGLKAGRFHSVEFDCKKTFLLNAEECEKFFNKLDLGTAPESDFEKPVAFGRVILKSGTFDSCEVELSVYKRKNREDKRKNREEYAMFLEIVEGFDEIAFMGPDLGEFLEPERISEFIDGE